MKHPHNHIPFLILAVVITLIVAALYAYMFRATAASVSRADRARSVVVAEEAGQSQAKSLSDLASSTALDRARLPSFFVPEDDVVVFISALESLGPESGSAVSIASIAADSLAGAPVGTLGAAHASIDARGSWPSVMRALSLAERMPYGVSIDHVRLDASADGSSARPVWSLSFDIQAAMIVPPAGS